LEHLQVLADGLEGDRRDEGGELVHRGVALGQAGQDCAAGRVGERPERDAQGIGRLDRRHQAVASVSSTIPEGAVRLSLTVNWLGAGPVKSFRPSPSTIGQISNRYSSISP